MSSLKALFLSLALVALQVLPAVADPQFPFEARAKDIFKLQGNSLVCSRTASAGLSQFSKHQDDFNRVYGPESVTLAEENHFLPFVESLTSMPPEFLTKIFRAEFGGGLDVSLRLLERLQKDLKLAVTYLQTLSKSHSNLSIYLKKQAHNFDTFHEFLSNRMRQIRKAAGDKRQNKVDELMGEALVVTSQYIGLIKGISGELQVVLRLPNVVNAGFRLSDLLTGNNVGMQAEELSKSKSGVTDLLAQVPNSVIEGRQGSAILNKAYYVLKKEFDILQKNENQQVWIEVKNFRSEVTLQFLETREGGRFLEKFKNQIAMSNLIRKIYLRLRPDQSVRLEFHFLDGISEEAKKYLQSFSKEKIVIVNVPAEALH